MAVRYRWDDFLLDLDTYRLERGGRPLALEPKAINLLALMVKQPQHLFTKQEIFEAVWPGTAVTDHALTRIVAQIRRALGDEAREARYLETVPTRGYRWIRAVEVEPVTTPAPAGNESSTADLPAPLIGRETAMGRWRVFAIVAVAAAATAILIAASQTGRTLLAGVVGTGSRSTAPSDLWRGSSVLEPEQLTTFGGLDVHPAFSPLDDAVAFASDRTGAFEIYVAAIKGAATETPITHDGGQNVQPAWSPDGRFIAYHSYRNGGIWVMPARGGTPRQLAAEGSSPVWSPDGLRIAYQTDEHAEVWPNGFGAQVGSTIWVVDAAGGLPVPLTTSGRPSGGHGLPAWSPDGRYLTFSVFDSSGDDGLWLLDVKSDRTRPLIERARVYESLFAPNGLAIYAVGRGSLVTRLAFDPATGSVAGGAETIAVPGVPDLRGLTVSSDGTRFAFAGLSLNSQIWMQPIAPGGTPMGEARALTSDTSRRNSNPAISPDGTMVAYVSSRRGGDPNIWVLHLNGGATVQMTTDPADDSQPMWLPDGRRIIYQTRRRGRGGVWATDVATRREEQVLEDAPMRSWLESREDPASVGELQFAPSMRRLAFSLRMPPSGLRRLYLSNTAAFAPRAIEAASVSVGYPAWSPDERLVAVEIKDGSSTQAGVIDVEGGALTRLTSERGQAWVRSWSPDGRKIATAVQRDGAWSLVWIDAASGRQETIVPPGAPSVYVRYPDWSRRGNVLVFERAELKGNIWLLTLR